MINDWPTKLGVYWVHLDDHENRTYEGLAHARTMSTVTVLYALDGALGWPRWRAEDVRTLYECTPLTCLPTQTVACLTVPGCDAYAEADEASDWLDAHPEAVTA